MNNVFVVKIVNERVLEVNKQKQQLGGNCYFEKPVLIACENNKIKGVTKKTRKYAAKFCFLY